MSMGISRANYFGSNGEVTRNGTFSGAGGYDFLYVASTTKDPVYNIGDRVMLPDGRVFRYATAGANGVYPELGAAQAKKSNTSAVVPAQATAAAANDGTGLAAGVIGSRCVSVTIASPFGHLGTGVLTLDELKGGYIVVGHGSAQHPQMRMITGNPVLAAAGICRIYIDSPLTTAVTVGTTYTELIMNPYVDLVNTGLGDGVCEYGSVLGVPAISATVGEYFWLQTWGPCWVTSAGNTSNGAYDRQLFWDKSGLVVSGADITIENGYQPAGFAIDASSSGASNAPFVMLQQSP